MAKNSFVAEVTFNETNWVLKRLHHWSACKRNNILTCLISHALSGYTSAFLAHCLVSFLSVRPADQQRRQLEVILYSMLYSGSAAGLLARKIRSAMTVVVELWITHYQTIYSFDLVFLTNNFHYWVKCFWFEKYFSLHLFRYL